MTPHDASNMRRDIRLGSQDRGPEFAGLRGPQSHAVVPAPTSSELILPGGGLSTPRSIEMSDRQKRDKRVPI